MHNKLKEEIKEGALGDDNDYEEWMTNHFKLLKLTSNNKNEQDEVDSWGSPEKN